MGHHRTTSILTAAGSVLTSAGSLLPAAGTALSLLCCSTSATAAAAVQGLMVDGASVHRFNATTGAVLETHAITGKEFLGGMLAMDPAQQYLYSIDGYNDSQSDRTFRIDWRTGVGTTVGNTGFNFNFRWLDFHPQTGVLYAGTDSQLYTINPATGAATFLRNITTAPGTIELGQITAFAISPNGQAYIADLDNWGRNDYQLYTLNLATGQASRVGTMFTGSGTAWASDLTFDPDGNLYATRRVYPSPTNQVFRINTSTGAPTLLYNVGADGLGGPGVAFVTVPEPTTGLFALVAAAVVRRTRRRRA